EEQQRGGEEDRQGEERRDKKSRPRCRSRMRLIHDRSRAIVAHPVTRKSAWNEAGSGLGWGPGKRHDARRVVVRRQFLEVAVVELGGPLAGALGGRGEAVEVAARLVDMCRKLLHPPPHQFIVAVKLPERRADRAG